MAELETAPESRTTVRAKLIATVAVYGLIVFIVIVVWVSTPQSGTPPNVLPKATLSPPPAQRPTRAQQAEMDALGLDPNGLAFGTSGFVELSSQQRSQMISLGVSSHDRFTWLEILDSAEAGDAEQQVTLGCALLFRGLNTNALKWFKRAGEQGHVGAQVWLAEAHAQGKLVPRNDTEALRWYGLAAAHGNTDAQIKLARWCEGQGFNFSLGSSPIDYAEAWKWYKRLADEGNTDGYIGLSQMYEFGHGVPKDLVRAYAWLNLAAARGHSAAAEMRDKLARQMDQVAIARAQRISNDQESAGLTDTPPIASPTARQQQPPEGPRTSGSGFFITDDGYFVTNRHVIADSRRISVRTLAGVFSATLVREDIDSDLAILKLEGKFSSLCIDPNASVKVADRVSTTGFPNPTIQGLAAKYSSGEIAALSGPGDDPRFVQISVPIQPGNSGGPLVDASGRVVGVVVAQLDKIETLKITGNIPENVNYAIKGTILLGVLEAVPGLIEKLKPAPANPPRDQSAVADLIEKASGLVLVER